MQRQIPDKEKNCEKITLLLIPQFALELAKKDAPNAQITIKQLEPSK